MKNGDLPRSYNLNAALGLAKDAPLASCILRDSARGTRREVFNNENHAICEWYNCILNEMTCLK